VAERRTWVSSSTSARSLHAQLSIGHKLSEEKSNVKENLGNPNPGSIENLLSPLAAEGLGKRLGLARLEGVQGSP